MSEARSSRERDAVGLEREDLSRPRTWVDEYLHRTLPAEKYALYLHLRGVARARDGDEVILCAECGTKVVRETWKLREGKPVYCSRHCAMVGRNRASRARSGVRESSHGRIDGD